MKKHIPLYITDVRKLPFLLLFIFIFSILFLLVYTPFKEATWYDESQKGSLHYFLYILLPVVCGIIVLSVSRTIMHCYHKKWKINYLRFAFWVSVEIIVMALIYASVNKFFLHDIERAFWSLFTRSAIYIGLVLLIPYSLAALYFALEDKNGIIRNLKARHIRKSRSMKEDSDLSLIHFGDDTRARRFSVRAENLIYIEGADNYIKVYYLNKGEVSNYMCRNSLKKISNTLHSTRVVRCHRSFAVNIEKMVALRKENESIFIELDHPDVPNIPISKTYSKQFFALFDSLIDNDTDNNVE